MCACQTGFTGAACDRLACPGATNEETDGCSGHGQCLDMNTLAVLATVNGVLAGYTYGDTPNNPATWDATRLYGCLCDPQYEGYDCSLYVCPHADDPDTYGQRDEQQLIKCADADRSGNIVLTFRQYSTTPLAPNSTSADVRTALELLPSVGEVSVEPFGPSDIDRICQPAGNQLIVTFKTEHGDLPLIQFAVENIDGVSDFFNIVEHLPGTKENLECAGRGLCDHSNGQCSCFPGYGSSDGKGGKGNNRDCGYLEPILAPNNEE